MKQYIFDQFVNNIVNHTGYTKEEIFSTTKKSEISLARKVLYKLCIDRGFSIKAIEEYMERNGYKCHTNTIHQALVSLDKIMANDPDYQTIIKNLSDVEA